MTEPALLRLARPDTGAEELEAIGRVLRSGILTNGPQTAEFEGRFATRHQVDYAVAFANGTVALAAMMLTADIGPGSEVIVPSLSFISTATSVNHVGAVPVFAEVEPHGFNLDPVDVQRRITKRTRAIMAVHYAGQPADMARLRDLAADARVLLFEDAAEAHGAEFAGRPVGGWGDAAMFSFTPTKNITTGEGGMVTTNNPAWNHRLRLLRNHGLSGSYFHTMLGYNWRLTEMQAAMGVVQLGKLDGILDRKRRNAQYLGERLSMSRLLAPQACPDRSHTYMLYTLMSAAAERDALLRALPERNIEARLYFPPIHKQPVYADRNLHLPVTETLAAQMLSVPFHSLLTRVELDRIADALIELAPAGTAPIC